MNILTLREWPGTASVVSPEPWQSSPAPSSSGSPPLSEAGSRQPWSCRGGQQQADVKGRTSERATRQIDSNEEGRWDKKLLMVGEGKTPAAEVSRLWSVPCVLVGVLYSSSWVLGLRTCSGFYIMGLDR